MGEIMSIEILFTNRDERLYVEIHTIEEKKKVEQFFSSSGH
jgi:hypothetical protein